MLVMPALAALLAFVCLRPHEVFESLSPLTFNLMAAMVIFGYVLDVRLRVSRPRTTPQVVLVLAYFAFGALSVAVKASERLGEHRSIVGGPVHVLPVPLPGHRQPARSRDDRQGPAGDHGVPLGPRRAAGAGAPGLLHPGRREQRLGGRRVRRTALRQARGLS